jgi:hypothetical protein
MGRTAPVPPIVFSQNAEMLRAASPCITLGRDNRMSGAFPKLIIVLIASTVLVGPRAEAGSLGDFFKALGNSIAHPGQHKKTPTKTTTKKTKSKSNEQAAEYPPTPAPTVPPPSPSPTPTVSQPPVRPASAPPTRNSKRDIPYGIPVPNKPGFVTSPYSPKSGYVDVRGFPSGTEVKDPYSGKTFLTP